MTTIPDLLAQRDALDRQIAEAALPLLQAAQETLTTEAVSSITTALQPIFDQLPPGQGKEQIGNVLIVLRAVPDVIVREIAAANSLLTDPPVVEAPAA